MSRALRVWGGGVFWQSAQVRALVVADTKETANARELALLTDGPSVWVYPDLPIHLGADLTRLPLREAV